MKLPIKFLALTVFALLASPAYSNEADAKNKQKWYRLEAIIFTQKDVFGDELSSRDIVLAYPENLIDLDNNRVGFTPLPQSERKLGPDAYSLNRTGVYKVLFHKAWLQPGLAPARAPWVNIDISDDNTALSGSLRVYLSSYLHLESNLWHVSYGSGFQSPGTEALSIEPLNNESLNENNPLDSTTAIALPHAEITPWPRPPTPALSTPASPAAELMGTTNINQDDTLAAGNAISTENSLFKPMQRKIEDIILLKQASRLKLNKLHYFDHPKMGLLLKISRATAPAITNQNTRNVEDKPAINEALN